MTLAYDALEPIEKRIRQVRADIGYITISEVVDRVKYESLGRIDFTETDLAPYAFESEIPEFEEAGQLGDLGDAALPGDAALRLAEAACKWVREMVATNMHGQEEGRFRLFVWRPKGEQILFTARFGCTDTGFVPGTARELAVIPTAKELLPNVTMTTERVALLDSLPEGRVWGALGAGHAQLIELSQKTYGHLATLQNTTIHNQNTQILRMAKVIEEMAAEQIKLRVGAVHADDSRRADGEESRVREELGKQFISEIGTFGRVVASAKFGMAPEMVELAEMVNASPELLEAMKNPEVRKMLRDEKTRKELAAMLLMAAGSAATPPPTGQSAAA
jgi:hypothetical protein